MSLEEIARQTGRDIETLKAKLGNIKQKLVSEGMAEKQAEHKALLILKSDLKFRRSKVQWFRGFFIGMTPVQDRLDNIRRVAKARMSEDFSKALDAGLIDADGRILDTRAKIFNRNNPNYGKPLGDKHDWFFQAWGLVSFGDVFKRTVFEAYGETCLKLPRLQTFKSYEFTALDKGETSFFHVLRASRLSTFNEITTDWRMMQIAQANYLTLKLKDAFNPPKTPFFTKVFVSFIRQLEERNIIYFEDETLAWNERAYAFLDKGVELPELDSEVVLFTKARVRDSYSTRDLVLTPLSFLPGDSLD